MTHGCGGGQSDWLVVQIADVRSRRTAPRSWTSGSELSGGIGLDAAVDSSFVE